MRSSLQSTLAPASIFWVNLLPCAWPLPLGTTSLMCWRTLCLVNALPLGADLRLAHAWMLPRRSPSAAACSLAPSLCACTSTACTRCASSGACTHPPACRAHHMRAHACFDSDATLHVMPPLLKSPHSTPRAQTPRTPPTCTSSKSSAPAATSPACRPWRAAAWTRGRQLPSC